MLEHRGKTISELDIEHGVERTKFRLPAGAAALMD
jgi:hypothetical protein